MHPLMLKRYWQLFPLTITLCPLLGLLAVGILTLLQPKVYEATTVLQVRHYARPIDTPPSLGVPKGFSPTIWCPTEFEVVKSQETLDIVIDELDLLTRWNVDRDIARRRLSENIHAQKIRESDLIEIRVHAASPEQAQNIAVTLTEVYRARRTKLETQRTEQAIAELRDAVKKQEATVEDKRKTLTTIIRNQELLLHHIQPSKTKSAYSELLEQKVLLESQIETLLKYDGDQLMTYAAGLQLPENIIRTLHPQYLEAKRTLTSLQLAGLGDAHPSVTQQKEKVDGMRRDLDEGIIALRETLRAQLELSKSKSAELESKLGRQIGTGYGIGLHGFDDAKAEFETAQRLLEQLKIKLIAEEMQRRITESPIIIHAEPTLPEKPVYPQFLRNLTIGLLSGIALGIISPLLFSPVLMRRDSRESLRPN
ncbi:GumC family protein [Haloferula chungangensis]|uniref:GumC family protein n=1 Tax=Haloferula chungangensis TaxID=1048331 RepID=A0ABW2LA38_9BACT